MTTKLETICTLGHVEHEDPTLASDFRFCSRVAPRTGLPCLAEIHTRTLLDMPDDEAVRPGPDDSVATEVNLLLDQKVTIIAQIEAVAQMLLDRGISLTGEQAEVVHHAMVAAGEALPRVQDLIRTADPVDEEIDETQGCWHYDYQRFCTQCDPASYEPSEEEDEPVRVPFLERARLALQPLALDHLAMGLLPYRPLLVSAAILSAAATYLLFATGHWILALLV